MIKTILLTIELTAMLCSLMGCAVKSAPAIVPEIEPYEIRAQLERTQECPCVNCGCPLCVCEVQPKANGCKCDKCQCAKSQETVAKEPALYFEFHTSPFCGVCQQWKSTVLPSLKAAGWIEGPKGHIRVIEYGNDGWPNSLPLFRFYRRGVLLHEHVGSLTSAEIGATFNRLKRGREVIQSGVSTRSIAGVIAPGGPSSRAASVLHEADYAGARRPLAVCLGCR